MIEQAAQEFFSVMLIMIINLVVPSLTYLIARYLIEKYRQVRASLTYEQGVILDSLVTIAVKAEEQTGLGAALKKSGDEKLDGAVARVQEMLDARNLKHIPVNEIVSRIEAAIRDGLEQGFPAIHQQSESVIGFPIPYVDDDEE